MNSEYELVTIVPIGLIPACIGMNNTAGEGRSHESPQLRFHQVSDTGRRGSGNSPSDRRMFEVCM